MTEAAIPVLDRMARLAPINQEQASIVRESGEQAARLQAGLGPPPPQRWENLSQLDQIVRSLLLGGRPISALGFLERAYPSEPRPWEVTNRMATLALHLGEPARARALWEHASAPPRPALRAARVAWTYLVEDDFESARRQYRVALREEPDLFDALYGLALLEQDAGRAGAAVAAARHAVTSAPGDVARSAASAIAAFARPYDTDLPAATGSSPAPSPPRPDRNEAPDVQVNTIRR